jgi:hypothetical protein
MNGLVFGGRNVKGFDILAIDQTIICSAKKTDIPEIANAREISH